jgi:hypothetical protein
MDHRPWAATLGRSICCVSACLLSLAVGNARGEPPGANTYAVMSLIGNACARLREAALANSDTRRASEPGDHERQRRAARAEHMMHRVDCMNLPPMAPT